MDTNTAVMENMENKDPKKTFREAVKDFFGKDLVQYIIKRVLMFIPTIILVSILVFFVIQLPPGDYVSSHISALMSDGEMVSDEEAKAMREDYGLDKSIAEQYIKWVSDIIWTPTDSSFYRIYKSHHNW